ncbi:MAG: hypothetical protein L0331_06870, partial [Chloroflexi bacterium]|nr:hypothetical protein [Chloroflexota bacterium]
MSELASFAITVVALLVAIVAFVFGGRRPKPPVRYVLGGFFLALTVIITLVRVFGDDAEILDDDTSQGPEYGEQAIDCNWAERWQLQADNFYFWVGLPPGTPGCQNVGQAGELLQRLRNGEDLTLIVDVGDSPLG